MKEHPIIFSTDMIKAILDDRKTMTRRVIKHPERYDNIRGCDFCCPYGHVGDRLWVKETWQDYCPIWSGAWCGHRYIEDIIRDHRPVYKADTEDLWIRNGVKPDKWRPSIFMPHWASRITLEITEVRVERLQEIVDDDVIYEGTKVWFDNHPQRYNRDLLPLLEINIDYFAVMWDEINKKRDYSWESNPWVWVISFRRIKP